MRTEEPGYSLIDTTAGKYPFYSIHFVASQLYDDVTISVYARTLFNMQTDPQKKAYGERKFNEAADLCGSAWDEQFE